MTEIQKISAPVAHKLEAKRAETDSSVTPEYIAWLESLYPARNGVGGNEAWNAGAAWARGQIQQGWKLVPAEPTREQVMAAHDGFYEFWEGNPQLTQTEAIAKWMVAQPEPLPDPNQIE